MNRDFFENNQRASYPTLRQTLCRDYAVLGGGVCAAMTAYLLSRAGKSVALICPESVCGDSCGLMPSVCFCSSYGQSSPAAAQLLAETAGDFEPRDLFMFSDKKRHMKKIRAFSQAWGGSLYLPEQGRDELSFARGGVYVTRGGGVLSPPALCQRAAAAVSLGGGSVFENSPILGIADREEGYIISTPEGRVFVKKTADCRGLLFDGEDSRHRAYVGCSFRTSPFGRNYADFYKKQLSYCFYKGRAYGCVEVSLPLGASPLYLRRTGRRIRRILENMLDVPRGTDTEKCFFRIVKTPKTAEAVIKTLSPGFYACLCPYENGTAAAAAAAVKFTEML